jgi:2-(1,2-epoxy-1,2-dihydrophenyl)acetyl-CoA isomerase
LTLEYDSLGREDRDGVAWLRLGSSATPPRLNDDLREELVQALLVLQSDDSIRVIVLSGEGQIFCHGFDAQQRLAMKEEGAGFEKLLPEIDSGRRIVSLIHEMPKPVLAMVNGAATGTGFSLALACDIRVASDHASFAPDTVRRGMHPQWGATYFLPRLVGTGRSMELLMSGRRVEAEEALQMGLVQEVVPEAHLKLRTERLALRLAKAPSHTLRLIKLSLTHSGQYDLTGMLEIEGDAQRQCWESSETTSQLRNFVQEGRLARRPLRLGRAKS